MPPGKREHDAHPNDGGKKRKAAAEDATVEERLPNVPCNKV